MNTAILTKYHGPTNRKGSRISATANGNRIYIPYPHHCGPDEANLLAAERLCHKMGWRGELVAGRTPIGYVFVFKP